ncbi:hypothetical protein HW555_010824 [Spodoptera exigua]|uniref:Cytochrome p450 n=1 Tax=Spodoptera exigua TaxID=7107 RepID=A0A835L0J5_SPOEX|nr:hypothetical protein HW555_010824 [Spodoptera exigua]
MTSYKLPPMYPGVLPIIGHAHLLIGNTTRLWTMVQKLAKQALDNGGVISGFIGKDLYYIIADPEDSVTAANACLHKHFAYDFGKPWMGEGLVLASGPTWKRHRKLLNPAFSLQVLHSFLGSTTSKQKSAEEIRPSCFIETHCFRDITAFGITADEDKDFNKLYMAAVDQILNIIAMRFSNFWLQSDLIYNFTELRKKQDEVVKVLNAMSTAVIKRKKEQMKSLPREEWEAQRQRTGIKCKALMDLLLELAEENTLTDKEIREEVDTAIVASYDTTSCLLAYIMMMLGTYPEAQEKMYKELEEIFEGTDRDVTKDDLPRMVYTDAVIKETLRLIPTGPVGLRYVDKDVQLKNFTMRAGSQCALLIYGIHYHESWGPDVREFKPERWLDPNNAPNPNMFAGFSIGKRACMGRTFATLSMKTTLSHVLRRFKIKADINDLKLKIDFLLKPVSGSLICRRLCSVYIYNLSLSLQFAPFLTDIQTSTRKMIGVLLFCVLMCLCAIWAWLVFVVDGKHKLPPIYPGHLPIIGHLHLLIDLWNFAKVVAMKAMERGGVLVLIMGYRIYYAITDPEDALTAANACLQKHFTYDYAKPWLGEGLITSSGEIWRRHRKLLTPAFSLPVMLSFLEVFNSQSRMLVENLKARVGKGKFDHTDYLRNNALQTFCLTAFGFSTGFEDKQFIQKYMRAVDEILNIKFWLQSQVIFKLCGYQKRQDELVKIVNDMSDKVIQMKKAARLNGSAYTSDTKYKPFLDLLLELSDDNALSDKEIREEVDTAIVTGFDTTSSLLSYIMILLGTHPEIQENIYQEIKQVFPTDRDVDKDDLQKLVYTEAVIKESLRVFTTGPVTLRYVDKDVKLKNYTMRAGSQCIILLFGAHRDPVWGKDVAEFRPERWLDPDTPVNPGAFIGFSLGKRSCLGRTYAMISMKTTLVHFLRTYKVSADDSNLKLKVGH